MKKETSYGVNIEIGTGLHVLFGPQITVHCQNFLASKFKNGRYEYYLDGQPIYTLPQEARVTLALERLAKENFK